MRVLTTLMFWLAFAGIIATPVPQTGVADNPPEIRPPNRIALIDMQRVFSQTERFITESRSILASLPPNTPTADSERQLARFLKRIYQEILQEVGKFAREQGISLVLSFDDQRDNVRVLEQGPNCILVSPSSYMDRWIIYPSSYQTYDSELEITETIIERLANKAP